MSKRFVHLLLCFVVCASVQIVESVSKRSDIDLQTCIENFGVHEDKIIRTQDSRNMGAKYLNEIDLGSREECLRLCCETDTCDVFVYEEKSPGSCYLFHCGPPEDFKCKFTRHANYSSAVLAVNRHLNELENQIKLTKHEQDLTRLRKPEDLRQQESIPRAEVTRITPTLDPTTTTPKSSAVLKEILPQMEATIASAGAGRRCSRYQFECRSSGECIAIYNACDGIPQCADGSDEAPELGCPDLATTIAPSPPPPPLPIVPHNVYEQANQLRKSLPSVIADNPYQQSPSAQVNSKIPPLVEVTRDNTDFLRPVPDVRGQPASQPGAYNEAAVVRAQPQQAFIAPRPASPNNNNNWMVHPANQMPMMPQNSQYADKNSHIFNHKESGLQVVDSPDRYKYKGAMQTLHRAMAMGQYVDTTRGGASGAQYGDMNVRNDYQKMPNYYNDMYRQQYQMPENWPPNRAPLNGDVNPYLNDNFQPVQIPQTQNVNDQMNPVYRQNSDIKPNWKADFINTQAESKAYDHTIIHESKDHEPKVEHKEIVHELPKVEEHVQTTSSNNHHDSSHHTKEKHAHEHVATAEELKQRVEDLLDGEAERPNGAVLSLTLGVCLTCMMAILIGCRLRVVRRRMRRGGKSPYAHDADYLVNGMYL